MAVPPLAGEGCELHTKAFCAPFSCMESLLLSLPAAPRARGDAASVLLALFSPKGCGRVVLGSPWVQADRSQLLLCCLPFTDPPGALRVVLGSVLEQQRRRGAALRPPRPRGVLELPPSPLVLWLSGG